MKLGLAISLAFDGSFLVAWGKVLVEFSVNQIIAQDPARAPVLAVGPSFDSRRRLLVDKNVSAADEVFSFPVVGSAGRVHQDTSEAGLDDLQRVNGGHDHAAPSGRENIARGRRGRGQRLWMVGWLGLGPLVRDQVVHGGRRRVVTRWTNVG